MLRETSHDARSSARRIAVVGSGISGLAAAWLLSRRHTVTLYEAENRLGGHSFTVDAGETSVDMGFIVYNEATYPNLTALFRHLGVETRPSEMTFAVSLDGGHTEYAGTSLDTLFAQRGNLASPRFWSMLRDLARFYRNAPRDLPALGDETLGDYLDRNNYGRAFRDDHLLPMAAAVWSTPAADMGAYPAAAFIRFCENHGLLKFSGRPIWRTVVGGSRTYVAQLIADFDGEIVVDQPVQRIGRNNGRIAIDTEKAGVRWFDDVVIATHADQALRLLADAGEDETSILGSFGCNQATAILHDDPVLMPRRRKVWSSWNYLSDRGNANGLSVTYWMNRLQGIAPERDLFVTLNPLREPRPGSIIKTQAFEHPKFDAAAMRAQTRLWDLQGRRHTWFCGAYFGAGFHEDGLQAGLAVAEQLGGVRRPWNVADESGRIHVRLPGTVEATEEPVS